MTEAYASSLAARVETARSLAAALPHDGDSLAGALLETLSGVGALVTVKDLSSGRYLHVSPGMAALFDRKAQDMQGAVDADLMEASQAVALRSADLAALDHAGAVTTDHRLERQGRKREYRVTRVAVPAEGEGSPRQLVSAWVDVTDAHLREGQLKTALLQLEAQQVAVEQLRRDSQDLSLRDDATGLYQRAHFDDLLRREVDLSSREHREFSLVTISLDPPNADVLAEGATARARVLEALGRLLRSNTRAMDASCRLDEERFAVLLSGVGLATAHSRMEGLRRQCATQIVAIGGRDFGFTVSMGVASFPHTAHVQDDLMVSADKALAEAQRRGGNHVTLASIRFELE
jgi:diguanylate cyclase (GGDEF)-like protein